MLRVLAAAPLLLIATIAQAEVGNCGSLTVPALPVQPTVIAPIAPELVAPSYQLGSSSGVLSQALDESLSVDRVLLRMRIDGCNLANAKPAAGGMPTSNDPAAYKPKTQFDNTPWRFDMSQGGKRMTADEFSAWMKAKGVRVAKGAPGAAAPAPAPAPVVEAPKDEKKGKKK
ncbi:hypothetical protein LVB77_06995 [Lysobacter sp. 5GHs7-4]|uniref:hypothetical protein n=1 Tax=Lysobacter sp. 5GHs7-4 TaxID=2904253 RepID=UPI00182B2289|nr:hypothetical protein [Lysobacter sp. 5GHs7-4]NUO76416.1 hypothetical protein [Lysobacter sp.]UHQ24428.1 hypothetical protein LVB77_06995 [Lysobacter sp. 5GHs7-4]